MRVISYIQCTAQVMMNLSTTPGIKANDILKYVSASFSVFCEYFINTSSRVRNAAFSALRIILTHCIKKEHFMAKPVNNHASEILNLDALTLDEEMSNLRKGGSG